MFLSRSDSRRFASVRIWGELSVNLRFVLFVVPPHEGKGANGTLFLSGKKRKERPPAESKEEQVRSPIGTPCSLRVIIQSSNAALPTLT